MDGCHRQSDVSIVVITRLLRNRPKRIGAFQRCIRSIEREVSPETIELIFVDNAGDIDPTDFTNVPSFVYRLPKNYFLHYARDVGIYHAKRKWILLLDDDIELEKHVIQRLKMIESVYQGDAVISLLDHSKRLTSRNPISEGESHIRFLRYNPRMYDAALFGKKETFVSAGFFPWRRVGWAMLRRGLQDLGIVLCAMVPPGARHLCAGDSLFDQTKTLRKDAFEWIEEREFPETPQYGSF